MTLREQFRIWRRTQWEGTPVGTFVLESSPVPERPFVIVSGAFPRKRAFAIKRGETIDRAVALEEDRTANRSLAEMIGQAGLTPIPCIGADPAGSHQEESFWVWDATPSQAAEWGRMHDQVAVLLGDGSRCGLSACYPEDEPATPPDVVLLLHGTGDTGEGGPALLERELKARGWDKVVFLRPTFGSAQELAVAVGNAAPVLAVGLGAGGILAARSDAPWRIGVGAPWRELAGSPALTWPGLLAIHGGADPLAMEELAILPAGCLRLVDAEAGADSHAWIGRIADGVMRLWNVHGRASAANAAGWLTPGYTPNWGVPHGPNPNTGRAVVVAGLVAIWGSVLVAALCVWAAVMSAGDPVGLPVALSLAGLSLYGGVVLAGLIFYLAQRVSRSKAAVPARSHLGAGAMATSAIILLVVESLALWMMVDGRAPPLGFHIFVYAGVLLLALVGLGMVSSSRRG